MQSGLKINKTYAEKYNKFREREELQNLKDKYGDADEDDESDSSSETEDEDAEALNPQLEKDWLRTLSLLKNKDPKIYQNDFSFYSKNNDTTERSKNKKVKPIYPKDYERKVILEKDGAISSESDEDENEAITKNPSYYEEQDAIRKSFLTADQNASDESDSETLLSHRKKTREEKEYEDEEYLKWLKGHKDEIEDGDQVGIELKPLKNYWSDPKLDSGEKYLRDFILNKNYIEKDPDRIPTFDEVVNDAEEISDEEMLVKQEDFERKFNFRYEEPDPDFIKSYPITIGDSVRRKDTKRSDKRKEIKERKKHEKELKKEELKQLKNLKKKEIVSKLDKLKEITGNASIGFNDDDLNEDFDPKKHDEMMQKFFDEQYYGEEDDDQKPEFGGDDEDLKVENWDNWVGGEGYYNESDNIDADDSNFVMDCDYDPEAAKERKLEKKGKKKSKFSQAINKQKPVFDPEEKTFEEYFDEYYKLDYEDIIGDMPTRFKYRNVASNDFGLNVNEILTCKDKELNAWASLKKMTQYRTKEEEEADLKIFSSKGKNIRKKHNILTSLADEKLKEETRQQQREKQAEVNSKKSKKKLKNEQNEQVIVEESSNKSSSESELKRKHTETEQSSPKQKRKKQSEDDLHTLVRPPKVQLGDESKQIEIKKNKDKKKKKSKVSSKVNESSPDMKPNISTESDEFKNSGNVKGQNEKSEKKKKKKKKPGKPVLTDERLLAYGINPKKFKYMKIKQFGDVAPSDQ